MAAIHTKRNLVAAYEPMTDDLFVETWIGRPDGWHILLTQPIDSYQQAVAWAVSMADMMALPINIVPITGEEYLNRNREGIHRYFANMNDQARGAMRQCMVTTCATVMRDSTDAELRTEAYEVLCKLKVIEPC